MNTDPINRSRTVRILRVVMPIVALICIVVFPPWDGILAWLEPLPDTVTEQVDSAIDHGLDGIIVYVDQSGEVPAQYAAGWKNKVAQEPADPLDLFKIASISKLYIAAATAKLVGKHQLTLDASLADYLPELSGRIENADRISLKMLLQHRSGIPNFTDQSDFDWFTSSTNNTERLALILDKPADFEPDADYSYSNTNYLLIGSILDKTLGYSHQRYISNEILVPLGLTHTYGLLSQASIEDVMSAYHHPYEDDLREIDYTTPGGSMVATAQDVSVFLRALNNGSLLNSDEQAIYSSIYEYEHAGWLPGYQSIARYHEDIDTVVIQFVNTTSGSGNAELTANVVYSRIVKILRRQLSKGSE